MSISPQPSLPVPAHILITGASSGLGQALALLYAASGVRLSLHGRSAERLAALAMIAEKKGAIVTTLSEDVTHTTEMATWIAEMDRQQPLDLVIANAGISGGTSGAEVGRKPIDAIFNVNLNGVLNTIHPAISLMLPRKRGQIAIMSSLASFRGLSGSSAYAASKAAVRVYGEALRADLTPHGIRVNVICPGFVKTPMTDVNPFSMPFLMDADRAARIIRKGLSCDRARIAFPWTTYTLVRLMSLLPQDLLNRWLGSSFRKPALSNGSWAS